MTLTERWLSKLPEALPQRWYLPGELLDAWWARGQHERVLTWVRALGDDRGPVLARFAAIDGDVARSARLAREALATGAGLPEVLLTIPVSDPQVLEVASAASRRLSRSTRSRSVSWVRVRNPNLELPALEELEESVEGSPELVAWAATRLEPTLAAPLLARAWASRLEGLHSEPALLLATRALRLWPLVPEMAWGAAARLLALTGDADSIATLFSRATEPVSESQRAAVFASAAVAMTDVPLAWRASIDGAHQAAQGHCDEGLITEDELAALQWAWASCQGVDALEAMTTAALTEAHATARGWLEGLGETPVARAAPATRRARVLRYVSEGLAGDPPRPGRSLFHIERAGEAGFVDLVKEAIDLLEATLGPLGQEALRAMTWYPGRALALARAAEPRWEARTTLAQLAVALARDGHHAEAQEFAALALGDSPATDDQQTIATLAPLVFASDPSARPRALALAELTLAAFPGAPVKLEARPPPRVARSEALEAQLIADPDNRDAALVYADELQTHGDPRGELALLQDEGKTAEANALIARYPEHFLGPLASYTRCLDGDRRTVFEWRRGFIHRARLGYDVSTVGSISSAEGLSLEAGLEALLRHPSGALLHALTLATNLTGDGMYFGPPLAVLARVGAPALRHLRLGAFSFLGGPDRDDGDVEYEISWVRFAAMRELWPAVPRLESLTLQGLLDGEELAGLAAPTLRHLTIVSGGVSGSNVRAIMQASWPRLESLELWFGSPDYGASGSIDDLAPLFDGARFPALQSLGLLNATFANELPAQLAKAQVLPRVKKLGLGLGALTDDGAAQLVRNKPTFAHLETLDLSRSLLTDHGVELVAGLCAEVVTENQRDEDERYVAVGE